MRRPIRAIAFLEIPALSLSSGSSSPANPVQINIDTPATPPTWVLPEPGLLRTNTDACEAFDDRYFDERGYLERV